MECRIFHNIFFNYKNFYFFYEVFFNEGLKKLFMKAHLTIAAHPIGASWESKTSRDPLKHIQKISSKSVQLFRRRSMKHTRTDDLYTQDGSKLMNLIP